jgi:hypothetical protein
LVAFGWPQLLQPHEASFEDTLAGPEIAAVLPRVRRVAQGFQKLPQRSGGQVRGGEAGKHQHRVPVASRSATEQRLRNHERPVLPNRTPFERKAQKPGRP